MKRHGDIFDALEAAATPPSAKPSVAQHIASIDRAPSREQFDKSGYDEDMKMALEALDSIEHFASSRRSLDMENGNDKENKKTTPGQKLAVFLREQLVQREAAKQEAVIRATNALNSLEKKDKEILSLKEECALMKQISEDATFKADHLKEEIVRLSSENKCLLEKVQSSEEAVRFYKDNAEKCQSNADLVARETVIKLEKAHQRLAELEVKAHLAGYGETPMNIQEHKHLNLTEEASDAALDIFDDYPNDGAGKRGGTSSLTEKCDTCSVAESEDTVSEAAATLRFVARKSRQEKLQKREFTESINPSCQSNVENEKLLKSELATLERKYSQATELLIKANHAMKILQTKLKKERSQCAAIKEEKQLLQSRLHQIESQPSVNPEQFNSILKDLSECQVKIEALLEERNKLCTELEEAERRYCCQKEELNAAQMAQAKEASDIIAAEKSRRELLEAQVRELVQKVGETAANAAKMTTAIDAATDAQNRVAKLAAQVEEQKTSLAEKDAEISQLIQIAQEFGSQLMSSREACAIAKTSEELLSKENARLKGQIESLNDTICSIEKEEGAIERLAGEKAELSGRLRETEIAVDATRAAFEANKLDLEEKTTRILELETEVEAMRGELAAVFYRQDGVESAAADAASQLAQLTESHTRLEIELERRVKECQCAHLKIIELNEKVESSEIEKDSLSEKMKELESLNDGLQVQRRALESDLAHLSNILKESEKEIDALRTSEGSLIQELEDLKGRVGNKDATISALRIECDMLRRTGAAANNENQVLVDNMCDMNGLIDAVADLQYRNKQLEEECDLSNLRAAKARSDKESLELHVRALERELEFERKKLESTQSNLDNTNSEYEYLRSNHAVVSRQLEALEEAHKHLRQELADLQQKELISRSEAVAAGSQNDRLKEDIYRIKEELARSTCLIKEKDAEIDALRVEEKQRIQREAELLNSLQEERRNRTLAEGKVILARQKEHRMHLASKALKEVEGDILLTIQEASELKEAKETAEAQCDELTQQCMCLFERIEQLQTELSESKTLVTSLKSEMEKLTSHSIQLDDQIKEIPILEEKIRRLEVNNEENTAWCDSLTDQLNAKDEKLEMALKDLKLFQEKGRAVETQLCIAQEKLSAAEAACKEASAQNNYAKQTEKSLIEANIEIDKQNKELSKLKELYEALKESLQTSEKGRDIATQRAEAAEYELKVAHTQVEHLKASLDSASSSIASLESTLAQQSFDSDSIIKDMKVKFEDSEYSYKQKIEDLECQLASTSATCSSLSNQIEGFQISEQEFKKGCLEAEKRAEAYENDLNETVKQLTEAKAKLKECSEYQGKMEAEISNYKRSVEQLESQCTILREQIDFLHNAASQDLDLNEGVRIQLKESYEEQQKLRAKIAEIDSDMSVKNEIILKLEGNIKELNAVIRLKELSIAEMGKEKDSIWSKYKELQNTIAESEDRVSVFEKQSQLAEMLKEQTEKELEREKDACARAKAELLLAKEAVQKAEERRIAAEHEKLDAVQAAEASAGIRIAALERIEASIFPNNEAPNAITEAVDDLEKTIVDIENLQYQILYDQNMTLTNGAEGVTILQGKISSDKKSIATRDIFELSAKISPERLQLVSRLAAVQLGLLQIAKEQRDGEQSRLLSAEKAYHEQMAEWNEEKSVMKALCKLALAITMDQVGEDKRHGEDAFSVASQLEPQLSQYSDALKRLGLTSLWKSLIRLAQRRRPNSEALVMEIKKSKDQITCMEKTIEHANKTLARANEKARQMADRILWSIGDFGGVETIRNKNQSFYNEHEIEENRFVDARKQLDISLERLEIAAQRMLRRHRVLYRQDASSRYHACTTDLDSKNSKDISEKDAIGAHWKSCTNNVCNKMDV